MTNTQQKSVWLILDSAKFGGIESHVLQLACGLHTQKVFVTVILLKAYGDHPLINALSKNGIPYEILDGRFGTFRRRLIETQPIICHSHGYKAGIFTRFACIGTKTPCISTFHAGESCTGKLRICDFIDRKTAYLNTYSAAVSNKIRDRVSGRCAQLNNFIDTENIPRSSGNKIAFVGRLSEEKAPFEFIQLTKDLPEESFCIYGDGPLRAELSKIIGKNCQLIGHVEMTLHWSDIKCLVICSKSEGLPLCLLEAMARGITVVSYEIGQIPHVIEHKKNGYLAESQNYDDLLANVKSAIRLNESDDVKLRESAREKINNTYSTQVVLPQYLSIYRNSIARKCNAPILTNKTTSTHNSCTQTNSKLNVLFVHYGENWIRGSEQCLLNLVTDLKMKNINPIVWCNSTVLLKELRKRNIETIKDHFTILFGWEKPRFNVSSFIKLVQMGCKLISKHQIHVIHTNGGAPNQWMLPAARHKSIPLVTQLHAPYLLRDRISLSLHEPDSVVGVSNAVLKPFGATASLLQAPGFSTMKSKFKVIHNGIDLSPFSTNRAAQKNLRKQLKLDNTDFVIASVGSLIHRKGFDLLITAIAELRKDNIPAKLIIVGNGDQHDNLVVQAKALKVDAYVHFLGERGDVSAILQSDIDVLASGARDEAFGLVFAEAGAAGLPSVAPKVGGIPEVIIHNQTGLLVQPNSATQISDALKTLYRSPAFRKKLGENAKIRIFNNFDLEKNTESFRSLYQDLYKARCTSRLSQRMNAYLSPMFSLIQCSFQRGAR